MQLDHHMLDKQQIIDRELQALFAHHGFWPSILYEAMQYAVLNGGKRIRPILCLTTTEACQSDLRPAIPAALAVELFHCSTLIHDDLPCMDNDDLRRGEPTCHIQYGEATAVLAGDALMIKAFHVLAQTGNSRLVLELAEAAGANGVIAGQVEDLAAEGNALSPEQVDFIHFNKTATLIRVAVRMGGIVAGINEDILKSLSSYGEKIGMAFQIQDDILDETVSAAETGKPAGSDRIQSKMTYPAVYGMSVAKDKVGTLTGEAIEFLRHIPCDTAMLQAIAELLVKRRK